MSLALGLQITNTPGTAKVLGSCLTRPVFFSNGKSSVQLIICPLMFCRLNIHIVNFFLHYSCFYCSDLSLMFVVLLTLTYVFSFFCA